MNDLLESLPDDKRTQVMRAAIASRYLTPGDSPCYALRDDIVKAMQWALDNPDQVELFQRPGEDQMKALLHAQGWKQVAHPRDEGTAYWWKDADDEKNKWRWKITREAFKQETGYGR